MEPVATVGIAGTFDVANYGDLLFPRVFEHEMARRIPGVRVRSFSPFGSEHPVAIDAGRLAEPLGAWSHGRARELAESLDAFVIGGGELAHTVDTAYAPYYERPPEDLARMRPSAFFIEGLGTALERLCPTAWHCLGVPFDFDEESARRVRTALRDRRYVTVRDELSRSRLEAAGVEAELTVVPDSALLLDRLFATDVLERRMRQLVQLGQYPGDGRPVVVQGSGWMLRHTPGVDEAIAAALARHPEVPVVFVEIGPCHGDGEFVDAVAPRCVNPVHRLAAEAPAEDIVAAIAGARAYVGLSLHGAITALVQERPMAIVNPVRYAKIDGFAELIGEPEAVAHELGDFGAAVDRALARDPGYASREPLRRRVDEHFDRLAEMVLEARGGERVPEREPEGADDARAAYEARTRQMLRERSVYEELIAAADEEMARVRHELATAQMQLEHERGAVEVLNGRIAHAEAELHRVNTELLARVAEEEAKVRELSGRLERRPLAQVRRRLRGR